MFWLKITVLGEVILAKDVQSFCLKYLVLLPETQQEIGESPLKNTQGCHT